MTRKTIVSIVSILMLAVLASACVATQNISGRGTVNLLDGELADKTFLPGEATFSLNFTCYAQNNNMIEGFLNWKDPANGVTLKATLPETPVKKLAPTDDGVPMFTTCKQMKAFASQLGFSVNTAGTWNENGNADGDSGTQTGQVLVAVTQPGAPIYGSANPCGETGTAVLVAASTQQVPSYEVVGCLDRGKVTFGATQNQNQQ